MVFFLFLTEFGRVLSIIMLVFFLCEWCLFWVQSYAFLSFFGIALQKILFRYFWNYSKFKSYIVAINKHFVLLFYATI